MDNGWLTLMLLAGIIATAYGLLDFMAEGMNPQGGRNLQGGIALLILLVGLAAVGYPLFTWARRLFA